MTSLLAAYGNSSRNASALFGQFPYEALADERTRSWLLVDSFWNVLALVVAYLLMVRYGPRFMQRRKAFHLTPLLVVYNLAMALLNGHICKELLRASYRLGYSYWCEPCRVVYSKDEMKIASAVWWFYISKLLEFTDTLFFVLRKKSDQLSFLHVYHHSTMFPLWWIGVKWVPTGSSFVPALINSFVHVVMYSYYGISAMGPRLHKHLWWKKYITVLQLCQFVVTLLIALQSILNNCDFPLWMNYATIGYMLTFLVLFGRFYARKYRKSKGCKTH